MYKKDGGLCRGDSIYIYIYIYLDRTGAREKGAVPLGAFGDNLQAVPTRDSGSAGSSGERPEEKKKRMRAVVMAEAENAKRAMESWKVEEIMRRSNEEQVEEEEKCAESMLAVIHSLKQFLKHEDQFEESRSSEQGSWAERQ